MDYDFDTNKIYLKKNIYIYINQVDLVFTIVFHEVTSVENIDNLSRRSKRDFKFCN